MACIAICINSDNLSFSLAGTHGPIMCRLPPVSVVKKGANGHQGSCLYSSQSINVIIVAQQPSSMDPLLVSPHCRICDSRKSGRFKVLTRLRDVCSQSGYTLHGDYHRNQLGQCRSLALCLAPVQSSLKADPTFTRRSPNSVLKQVYLMRSAMFRTEFLSILVVTDICPRSQLCCPRTRGREMRTIMRVMQLELKIIMIQLLGSEWRGD